MKATEALTIINKAFPKRKVIECLEFSEFFAFGMVENGNSEDLVGGAFDTVDKETGEISFFNPTSDLKAFINAKRIDVTEL